MGPAIVFTMSAFLKTGTISIAASICSIILSKSDSKSSFPKPAQIFDSYYIYLHREHIHFQYSYGIYLYIKVLWE